MIVFDTIVLLIWAMVALYVYKDAEFIGMNKWFWSTFVFICPMACFLYVCVRQEWKYKRA